MSRTVIAAVVAVVIAALTAVAFFVTSTSIDNKIRNDAEAQLRRAYGVVGQLAQLEAIDVANKAERLAAEREFVNALKSESQSERYNQSRLGFTKFTSNEKEGDRKPDIIALVDAQGNIVAMNEVPSVVAEAVEEGRHERHRHPGAQRRAREPRHHQRHLGLQRPDDEGRRRAGHRSGRAGPRE